MLHFVAVKTERGLNSLSYIRENRALCVTVFQFKGGLAKSKMSHYESAC